jgi:transcriptional regulator with XRE-family HTH domain
VATRTLKSAVTALPVIGDADHVRGGRSGVSDREHKTDHSALSVFADELRSARAVHGLSQGQLAEKIAYSSSLIAMVEALRRAPSADFAKRCDKALETRGTLGRLQLLVAREAYPFWFRPFVELERTAKSLRWWEPMLIPGLLQTEDYARAVLRAARPRDTDATIDQLVSARIDRQEILTRDDPAPPDLWVVIDEGALRRPVGKPGVMLAQLERLIDASREPMITVQVLPISAGAHPGLLGPVVIAGFGSGPDVAYMDNMLSGQVIERADDVEHAVTLYDTLRAEALSPRASTDLIKKVVQTWT